MSEQQSPTPVSSPAMQALSERIARETPELYVMNVCVSPRPYLRVKDSVNGIIVGFSCEEEYLLYVQAILRKEAAR